MLENSVFKMVVDSTPLVSIDMIVIKNKKVLLGRRVNNPAKGYFFTTGGRVLKNETLGKAQNRILKDEVGLVLTYAPKFIGVFEHFYEDSMFDHVSTHYINLAYEYNVESIGELPADQHSEYKWFAIKQLLDSEDVHKYVKEYFR